QSIAAPLEVAGASAFEALAAYARALLTIIRIDRGVALMRLLIASAPRDPHLARTVLPRGGPGARVKLVAFLEREAACGRLSIADPSEAADFFVGMVLGQHQMAALLGFPSELTPEKIERIAREATRRFLRAYGG
ncbi:MAG: TetR/AcrR family transcriptional regulator C-terminal domain-containing protein, partial [Caulobacteraceae bacterium]